MTGAPFPLSAVVGQDDLKLALLLHAVDPKLGGVLIRGEKGSGKSTAARALATLLPPAPTGEPAPFVELPIGATEDRVVGTLDLEGALLEGRSRLRPGLLAAAHGGVLYVDEVNLLADHLVDVLIDAAAFGVNRIERDGLTAEHPARFVLVGSMNPEEGELRPQLLDRFGLAVEVRAPRDPERRTEVVRRRLAFDADPTAFAGRFAAEEDGLRAAIAAAGAIAADVVVSDDVLAFISRLCAELDAEGLRADLVLARGVAALAALDGRKEATPDDVVRLAPLALAHRRRRGPLDAPGLSAEELAAALERAAAAAAGDSRPEGSPPQGGAAPLDPPWSPGEDGATRATASRSPEPPPEDSGPSDVGSPQSGRSAQSRDRSDAPSGGTGPASGAASAAGGRADGRGPTGAAPGVTLRLKTQRPSGVLGRRNRGPTDRGGIVAARPAPDGVTDLAVAATVQAAAARRAAAPDPDPSPPLAPKPTTHQSIATPTSAPTAPDPAATTLAPKPTIHQSIATPTSAPTAPDPAATTLAPKPTTQRSIAAPTPAADAAGGAVPQALGTEPTAQRSIASSTSAVIERRDLRQAVREARTANLVVLCVDASGSMGATRRMEAAKGAAVSLLLDAYQRRDRVALVTFAGDQATVALRPTGSVEVARARLADLPTGGRTPLAAGLRTALDVARSARHRDPDRRPVIVVVTDGRATSAGAAGTRWTAAGPPAAAGSPGAGTSAAGSPGVGTSAAGSSGAGQASVGSSAAGPSGAGTAAATDPVEAALAAAGDIAAAGIEALVVDAEDGDIRLGLARQLAEHMGAHYCALPELEAGSLARAVGTIVAVEPPS